MSQNGKNTTVLPCVHKQLLLLVHGDHSNTVSAGRPLSAHRLCCSGNASCLFRAWVLPTCKYAVREDRAKWGSSASMFVPSMTS